jgi:calcineurin-like phosphoesterase family protein
MIWFTADLHLNDPNTLARRGGFPSDDELIALWNSLVRKGDVVYCLGDFALSWGPKDRGYIEERVSQLNGTKLLIAGNHDRKEVLRAPGWAWVGDYKEVTVKTKTSTQKVVLMHYPLRTWHGCHRGAWHLHGHCHGALTNTSLNMYDVGVDNNHFRPLSFGEVSELLQHKAKQHYENTHES